MKYVVTLGADTTEPLEVDIEQRRDGTYVVRDGLGTPLEVRASVDSQEAGLFSLLVDGQTVIAQPADAELRYRQARYTVRAENARDRASAAVSGEGVQTRRITASMPGRIVRVLCQPGAAVTLGSPLIVIEAMKMQNELCAKADAVVRAVHVSAGQTVERGALLVEFE
ncbi:MAG: biotin/lipoyl-containing protein [Pseudomonadota bacterium]